MEQIEDSAVDQGNLMTAQELADMFRISVSTLYRILKYGPAEGKNAGLTVDLRQIPSKNIGGRRFWSRSGAKHAQSF